MNHFTFASLFPILIWLVLVDFFLSICFVLHDGIAQLKRLHQIPCSRCAFFTGDYRLKCTAHPCKALSEQAIGCSDYEHVSSAKLRRSPVKSIPQKRLHLFPFG